MQRFRTRFRWPLISVQEAPPATDPNFANVVLLLHMNGANGSTTFTDNSSSAHVVTTNNNAQISTTQSKFGGASGLFDGVSDSLTVPSSGNFWTFTDQDFTVEAFVYPTSWPNALAYVCGTYVGGATGHWGFFINSSGTQLHFRHADTTVVNQAGSIPLNTWTHIAASRQSGILRMFVDGVQLAADLSFTENFSSNATLGIAAPAPTFPNDNEFAGHMDELRITKGVARYTANFTPPTAAFPNS